MMENELMQSFKELLLDGRNSGIRVLLKYWKTGERPKNPSDGQKALISLIEELSEDQKNRLFDSIIYCIDLSFFKLLSDLEQGTKDLEFKLTVRNKKASLDLINSDEDLEIRSNFLDWKEDNDLNK